MALSGLQDMMNTLNLDVKDNYDMFLKQYHQQTRPSPWQTADKFMCRVKKHIEVTLYGICPSKSKFHSNPHHYINRVGIERLT